MTTPRTNGTKSRPKANPYDYTHPLNKAAWKRLYDEMRAMVDVVETESRHYEDKAANEIRNAEKPNNSHKSRKRHHDHH